MIRQPVDLIGDRPWIVEKAIEYLEGILRPDMDVFEWGSGASTLWLAQRVRSVVTVEHDASWLAAVEAAGVSRGIANFQAVFCPVTPPDYGAYAGVIRLRPGPYDLVFVDGYDGAQGGRSGSRLACVQEALPYIRRPGALLLDNSGAASNLAAERIVSLAFSRVARFVGEVAASRPEERGITQTSIFEDLR